MTTNVEERFALPTLYNLGCCGVSLCEETGAERAVMKPARTEVEEPPKVPPPPPKEPPEPPEEPPEWPPEPPEPPEEPPEPEKKPRIKEPGAPPQSIKLYQNHTKRALHSVLKTYGVVCPERNRGPRDGTLSFRAKVKELQNRPFMRRHGVRTEGILFV